MALVYYKGNSQFLALNGFKDQSTTPATYINNATLTATLYDSTGAVVPGAQNMAGQYQATTNGNYRFPVDPTLFNPAIGPGYTLTVSGTTVGGATYHVDLAVTIKDRTKGTET